MRVLIIEPAGNLWGSERALLDYIARLPEIETAVCCPPYVPLIPELEKLSVRIFPFYISDLHNRNRLRRVLAAIGIVRACIQFHPKVIYLNQGGCYRVALPAAFLFNLPIVSHVRIFEDVTYFAAQRPNPRQLRGLVAISNSIANDIERFPALSVIKRHMVYDAYALRRFEAVGNRRVPNRIACIGRIVPTKGQQLLIDAVHWLVSRGIDIDCMIAGTGPSKFVRQLKARAQSGAGAAHIHWLGNQENVGSLLAGCAAVACPSHREPLGRVILEAWDAGSVPVVFERSGGAAEIILGADGGVTYAEQTVESLAKGLLAAIQLSQNEAAKLISNGRNWMANHCNPLAYASIMADILRDATVV